MHWMLVIALAFDLTGVKSEPNLERRSDRALENANAAMDAARAAYDQGDIDKAQTALDELKESVSLSYQSLEDTGKSPRNNAHYKTAEKATRALLRRLESFRDTVSVAERDVVETVRAHVSEIHDELLNGIMTNGRKRK
jgi:hypothetical protein